MRRRRGVARLIIERRNIGKTGHRKAIHGRLHLSDPRIFQMALDRMDLAAERVLYVGDVRCCDEVGSRAAGLHFVLIDASGRYAAPGAPRIGCIAELPCWIEQRFIVPGVEARPAVGPAPRAATCCYVCPCSPP